jgi:hypothetical protein
MNSARRAAGVAWFLVKFAAIAAALLVLWWVIQPQYVAVIGRLAALPITYLGNIVLDDTLIEVDDSGVLNTRTTLVYVYEARRYPINVSFLIANLPCYLALVLATAGLAWRPRLRALLLGSGILLLGHVVFLAVMFIFAREVQAAPEVPTAFGMFVMTLPFLLWIVFAYWGRVVEFFDATEPTAANPES